ncbi:MAG: 16S rRNA (guanine(527)-N(7))-methyltransferase RsmG [Spirochaetaceae bacterium]|jgi:16S rRNA (guanine527-N7)-methyltransferase|nr:16S rRNA (guanine(527)-N(7))-methyltransferase RsmG [Spirochaetaceae bacterium]
MPENLLEAGLEALSRSDADAGACFSGETAGLLSRYIEEIELFNPAYGLVGAKNRPELIVKHILDSLAPLGIIRRLLKSRSEAAVGDAGSGAGLPGIPLAIALPEYAFTLIERMERRVRFLNSALAALGLPNASAEAVEIERAGSERFDCLTFRALKPLDSALLTALFRLLKPEGFLAAYKGRKEAINAEMKNAESLTGFWEAVPLRVPFLEEPRHLVIIRKPA